MEITLEEFDDMTRDLLDRTEFTSKQSLLAAGLGWDDIDHVLLIGGSTRMPAVVTMLRELTGKEPDRSVAADEAVAHGAALHAGILLARRSGHPPRFTVKNVNSHSLGVVATDTTTKMKRNAILIRRNTLLPVTARRIFKTLRRGQKSVFVQIVKGESASPDECSHIGNCSVRDLPADLPKDTPIAVYFRYEENGRLTVTVKVAKTEKELRHEFRRENSLTQDQLDSWRTFLDVQ